MKIDKIYVCGRLSELCLRRVYQPVAAARLGESIPRDLQADERLRLGRSDCDDLANITCCGSRCSCDDRANLGSPADEIGAKFGHDTEGGIVSDIKGVGESVTRSDNCCRTCAELRGGSIEGIFDAFFHSISICVCVE